MSFVDDLTEYGLTRQEATIYATLLKQGSMSGYEVSKETGISKSNVYGALNGLTVKGAAYMEEGESTKYVAVEVKTFTDNYIKHLNDVAVRLEQEKPKRVEVSTGYITIQSSRHIEDKVNEMLSKCEKRLYILADSEILNSFSDKLETLVADGKKVVVLTDKAFAMEGPTVYYTEVEKGQIRFITDSAYVLTGELTGSADDTCLYSGKDHIVEVMKEALRNKIMLIEKNVVTNNSEIV